MTVAEAVDLVSRAGTVARQGDDLVVRVPRKAGLAQAIDTLRTHKAEALAFLSTPPDLMDRTGARIVTLKDGSQCIGVWTDFFASAPDSAALRADRRDEPTKPTEPSGSLIDELFPSDENNHLEQEQLALALEVARQLMNRMGVRILHDQTPRAIGVWSDIDSPQIREALLTLEMDKLPVRYLDGNDVPLKYKERKVPGEPVSLEVLRAMEMHPEAPWEVQEKLWKPAKPVTWAEYEDACLTRCFEEARAAAVARAEAGSAEAGERSSVSERDRSEAKQRGLWKPTKKESV